MVGLSWECECEERCFCGGGKIEEREEDLLMERGMGFAVAL